MKATKYTYHVTWSEEEQEFMGLCAEFPSLYWLDAAQEAALRGIVNIVAGVLEDMRTSGEEIPESLSAQKFFGRFMVRTTPDMHRQLTMFSAEAGVSLERYVNSRLF